MRAKINNTWQNITSGLWFFPTLLVGLAIIVASLLLGVDAVSPDLGGVGPWLFGGSASAARGLLQAIAGSMITVVSLAFSITIVAVQQASTQFSPRVIRNFMRDRANQIIFGVYIATFVYALIVLRTIREERDAGAEFVPALAISGAMLLALLCVGLLIFYIHHVATSLQVATIADEIHDELLEGIENLFPSEIGDPMTESERVPPTLLQSPPTLTVRSTSAGFIRVLEEDVLLEALKPPVVAARVLPAIGEYVFTNDPLVELWAKAPVDEEETGATFRGAFALGRERSPNQDILFSLRQLVDIALKALSPGINDPTTAEECLGHLGDVVAQLSTRNLPTGWRQAPEGEAVLLLNRPDFAAMVAAAFDQIRIEAAGDVHVTGYFLGILERIASRVAGSSRAAAIRRQVEEVVGALEAQGFAETDESKLRDQARKVLVALQD